MYGLVVTDPSGPDSEIVHAVFLDCRAPLLFIKRQPHIDRRTLSKEERKALDKSERESALNFGDWISFDERNVVNKCILDYKKEYALCRSRATSQHFQVEAICVFSPVNEGEIPKCFSDTFRWISVQRETAERFLPDVALKCWISVEVIGIETVRFSFGDFIEIADDQSPIFSTPWNREFHRYVVEVHDEEDENECCDMSPDNGFGLPAVLTDMVGLRTGGHTVLCFKYKHVPFLLAYCPPNRNSTLGDVIVFHASYSGPLHAYVIDFFKKKADVPSYGSKMMNFGTLPVLEVSARLSGLPLGYLRAVNDDLGIVHDRHGLLTPALLSAPKETIFEVYVADMRPNAFSRLSIRDVSEGTANLVKRYAALGYKPLKDLEGITIGSGRVFSREYAMLKIRFGNGSTDGWEELTPGTWIKFSAASDKGSPDFVVQKWAKSFERAAETVQHVCISEKYTFQTTCHYREDLGVLESGTFGFIDDPHLVCSPKKRGDPITLWVNENGIEACTRFVACSIEMPGRSVESTTNGSTSTMEKQSEEAAEGGEYAKQSKSFKQIGSREGGSTEHVTEGESVVVEHSKGSKCTFEGCIAHELLREMLISDDIQKAIKEAGADELLAKAMTAITPQ